MGVVYVGNGAFGVNNTTNSQAIAQPTCGIGDLLIAFVINKALGNAIQPPDGTWTELYQGDADCTDAADDHRSAVFWKIATATTGNHTFTKTTDDNLLFGGVIAAWRGVDHSNPIDATAVASQVNATAADNVTFPAFNPTETDAHVIFAAFYGNDLTTFNAAMSSDTNPDCTTRFDLETSTGNDASIAVTSGDTTDGSNIASRTWASGSTTDAGSTAVVLGLNPAPISITNLTSGTDTTDDSDSVTASISPSANKLILLTISSRADAVQPTISSITGNGLTWVEIGHSDYDASGSRRTVFLYRGMGASPTPGTITIAWGGTQTAKAWSVDEVSGMQITGSNGADAIVQLKTGLAASATSLTITLDNAFKHIDNATFGAMANAGEGAMTPGSGYTELSDQQLSGEVGVAPEWKTNNDTTVDVTSPTADIGGVAIEIRAPISIALTGSVIASINEADIVAGGKTIILTLTRDTWVASGATFNAQRQNIIDGITSAQSELLGWNNVVKTLQGVAGVVRTSDTVVTITLDAQPTYNITAQEIITATIPGTAISSGLSLVASPTFTIDTGGGGSSYSETYEETVTLTDTIVKTGGKVLSEIATHTDTLVKAATKVLLDTVTHTDSIIKGRIFAEITTLTDTIIRDVTHILTETVTHTDTVLKTAGRTLTETVTHTDTVIRDIVRTLTETVTHTDTFTYLKTQFTTLSETVTHTDTILNNAGKILTETITHTDTLIKSAGKMLSDIMTMTDTLISNVARSFTFSDDVTLSDVIVRSTGRIMTETTTLTDSVIKTGGKVLSEIMRILDIAALYEQFFTGVTIPSGWAQYGNSTWVYDGDKAVETTIGSNDPQKVIYTGADLPQERIAEIDITFTAVAGSNNDDRVGVAILSRSSDGKGYSLNFRNTGTLAFLNDGIEWSSGGSATTIAPAVGETWCFKGMYKNGIFYGKAWNITGAEPDWMIQWTRTPGAAYIYSGINGNVVSKTTKGNYDNFRISYVRAPLFSLSRTVSDTTTLTDIIVNGSAKIFSEVVTHTDSVIRGLTRTLIETVTHTDTFLGVVALQRTMTEVITLTDTFLHGIGKILTETISFVDSVIANLNGKWFRKLGTGFASAIRSIWRTKNDTSFQNKKGSGWYTKNNSDWED